MSSAVWVVRRTDDDRHPIMGTKVVFAHRTDAERYITEVLHGYAILYSVPLNTGPVTARIVRNTMV